VNGLGPESPAFVAFVHERLAAERIDPSYLAFVVRHLDAPDGTWRWCCGSNCDPCVERLGRVVDAARKFAGRHAPPPDVAPRPPGDSVPGR
jgi:hypothetical protein